MLQKLSEHPLFKGVKFTFLKELKEQNAIIFSEFSQGQTIYSPEDQAKRMGFLIAGDAAVYSSHASTPVLLRKLSAGDTFGVANLFCDRKTYVTHIVATRPCQILLFYESTVLMLLQKDPTFLMNYIHFLSDRICFLNQKISCFIAGSPENKLASFLVAEGDQKMGQYSLSISANSLSNMLNIGRASLYRAFDALTSAGLIARDGKKITVLDKNALKKQFC